MVGSPSRPSLDLQPPAHTASICPCRWGEEKRGSIDVYLIRRKGRSAIRVIAEVDTVARSAEAGAAPGQILSKAVARALNLDFLELPTATLLAPISSRRHEWRTGGLRRPGDTTTAVDGGSWSPCDGDDGLRTPRWEREGQEEGMRAAAALLHHTAAGRPLPSLLLLPPLPPQIDGQPFCSLAHEVAAMAAGSTRGRPLTAVFGGEGRRCGGGCNGDARRWRR